MNKLRRYFIKFCETGTIACTLLLVGSVAIQIYARFFMENTPAWTEEASRFFFIYTIAFASGIALNGNYFVSMDFFYKNLKPGIKHMIDIFNHVLIIILFFMITVYAIQFVDMGRDETSPSIGIKMSFAFISMLIMALSVSYFGIDLLIRKLQRKE